MYKEDKLYTILNEITTPGVEYITALIVKANEVFCFYGDGIQIADASREYERLRQEQAVYTQEKSHKKVSGKEKISLPSIPRFHLPGKVASQKAIESVEQDDEI